MDPYFATGSNATFYVQVNPSTLFIELMYGTSSNVPLDPKHVAVPTGITWSYNAQELIAVRDAATGNIVIQRKA